MPCLDPAHRLVLEGCASLRATLRQRGGDLLWTLGRPEVVVGHLVALAAAAGCTHVRLHHALEPGRRAVQAEDAVAAALSAAAAEHGALRLRVAHAVSPLRPCFMGGAEGCSRHAQACCHVASAGLPSSVHHYWGATLYHPDDLTYHMFDGNTAAAAAPAAGTRTAALEEQQEQRRSGGWNRAQQRYACFPRGMSDFRRVLQAHTPVRPPLPAPVGVGAGGSGGSAGGSGNDASVLPPLPADVAAAAAEAGLLRPLPTDLAAVYATAGPAAAAALARWEELVGQRCTALAPAGSGMHDPRSALPFTMGEQEGLQRLRWFLGLGAANDGSGPAAARQRAPITGYQNSRMQVGMKVGRVTCIHPPHATGRLSVHAAWGLACSLGAQMQGFSHLLQATGVDSSAKLSAFLSVGCLSPRTVHAEVMRLAAAEAAEEAGGQPPAGTPAAAGAAAAIAAAAAGAGLAWREPQKGDTWRWLLMHLAIRDHFIYSALREGDGEAPFRWFAILSLAAAHASSCEGVTLATCCNPSPALPTLALLPCSAGARRGYGRGCGGVAARRSAVPQMDPWPGAPLLPLRATAAWAAPSCRLVSAGAGAACVLSADRQAANQLLPVVSRPALPAHPRRRQACHLWMPACASWQPQGSSPTVAGRTRPAS